MRSTSEPSSAETWQPPKRWFGMLQNPQGMPLVLYITGLMKGSIRSIPQESTHFDVEDR